jgi:hypothetical protein
MFLQAIFSTIFFSILQRRTRIYLRRFFLLSRMIKPFFQICKEDPVYLRSFFMLRRIIKIFISSILQNRLRIFKTSFLLGTIIFIFSILYVYLRSLFNMKIFSQSYKSGGCEIKFFNFLWLILDNY